MNPESCKQTAPASPCQASETVVPFPGCLLAIHKVDMVCYGDPQSTPALCNAGEIGSVLNLESFDVIRAGIYSFTFCRVKD